MSSILGIVSWARARSVDFSWEIPDFFSLVKATQIDSPDFSILGRKWVFSVFPVSLLAGRGMRIMVWMLPPYVGNRKVCWTVWLKKSDGTAEKTTTRTHIFSGKAKYLRLVLHDLDLSVLQERRSEFVPDGTMTIICSMKAYESATRSEPDVPRAFDSASQSSNFVGKSGQALTRDYQDLLSSGDYSDATVRVQGQEFRVHRAILGARSPVFRAMFRHQTSERASGVVDIEDSEPDTFRRFLQYVYSGEVECLTPENATGLYELADKYLMEPLKEQCLDCIKDGLSIDTFCPAITLALKHDERELTAMATGFFAANMKQIVRNEKWKRFSCENPIEANEVLIKALDSTD